MGQPDAAKLREALGLPADASTDKVTEALMASGLVANQSEPTPAPDPAPQLDGPKPEDELVTASAAAKSPATVVIASSVWEETQNTIKKLSAFVDDTKRGERDTVIASAVEAGKFFPSQKKHFARLWDADPEGTRALIEGLATNPALAAASGYAELDDKEFDREIGGMFPPNFFASKGA